MLYRFDYMCSNRRMSERERVEIEYNEDRDEGIKVFYLKVSLRAKMM